MIQFVHVKRSLRINKVCRKRIRVQCPAHSRLTTIRFANQPKRNWRLCVKLGGRY